MPLYAKAGDVIGCTNGHLLIEIARDLRVGEVSQGASLDFKNPQNGFVLPPYGSSIIPACPRCSAPWYRQPGIFHFVRGGRPGWRGSEGRLDELPPPGEIWLDILAPPS